MTRSRRGWTSKRSSTRGFSTNCAFSSSQMTSSSTTTRFNRSRRGSRESWARRLRRITALADLCCKAFLWHLISPVRGCRLCEASESREHH